LFERTWTDPLVRRYLGGPLEGERLASKRAAPLDPGDLAVVSAEGGPVGVCNLRWYPAGGVELSVVLLPEFWGQGLARESCAAVIAWVLSELDTARVVAWTQVANARSQRLLTALGMVAVERFVKYGRPQVLYALGGPLRDGGR
jgi:RimJ/RimL family protein N-acetyltransferase